MPSPSGWEWVPLSQVAEMGTGHTPSRSVSEYWNGDIPWVGIRDAANHHGGTIFDTVEKITQAGVDNSAARVLPEGTVCLSRTASVGYVSLFGRSMATTQAFVTWTCEPTKLDARFLMYALIAEGDALHRFAKGTVHVTIYFPELKAFHICLPPLAEQRRIVAKLDQLMARTVRARADLARIPALIAHHKRAILAAAFGRELMPFDASRAMRPIRDVLTALDQGWSPKCESDAVLDGEVWAVMKTTAIQAIDFDGRANKRLPNSLEPRPELQIGTGDVLITRAGPRSRVGIACVVKSAPPKLILCDKAYRLRCDPSSIEPTYLALMLNTPQALDLIESMKTGISDSGLNLTQDKILALSVPVPPLDVQRQLVGRIESAFAWLDKVAHEHAQATRLLDHLDQALLAKAFRGELVPQDPADEPAAELLARIRAEPGGTATTTRKRKVRA